MQDSFFYFLSKGFISRNLKYHNCTMNTLVSIIIFTRSIKFIIVRKMNCHEYYQKVITKNIEYVKVIFISYFPGFQEFFKNLRS
jgi:hypothetical protein